MEICREKVDIILRHAVIAFLDDNDTQYSTRVNRSSFFMVPGKISAVDTTEQNRIGHVGTPGKDLG